MRVPVGGCEVVLLREGRVITRFGLDLPAGMLVEQITGGKRHFRCFKREGKLNAFRCEERVYIWVGSRMPDFDRLVCDRKRSTMEPVPQKTTALTGRQRAVLEGVICGRTLAEIGCRLGIRTRSVRHHVDALKRKFEAVTLSELVARAVAAGFPVNKPP